MPDVRQKLPEIDGGFGCIAADPPWRFDDTGSRIAPEFRQPGSGTPRIKYETLSTREIADLPVASIAARRAYLFLWCPSAMLGNGLYVAQRWGFRFVATQVWVKTPDEPELIADGHRLVYELATANTDGVKSRLRAALVKLLQRFRSVQIGMGHHVRNAHEIALICERGGMMSAVHNVPSVRFAPRGKHSSKPEIFQDDWERMCPEKTGARLELFARRVRPGWLCWGNEVDEAAAWRGLRREGAKTA